MSKQNFIIIMLLLFCLGAVYGQISTNEEPVSFRIKIPDLKISEHTLKILPSLDMVSIEKEDEEDESNGIPPRFGFPHKVCYNLDNSGKWTVLSNGDKIWRLSIYCPDALSINLLYDKFWIPCGAKFFIYNNEHKHSIGAFTSVNNKGNKNNIQGFATGLVYGNHIILEYYLPKEIQEVGVISIAYVVHGYRHIVLPKNMKRGGYGDSGPCQVNVNCSEGQNWQNEKNAVAMILVDGKRGCTGSLINTTANDFTPYFLTADHCLNSGDPVKYDANDNPILDHWTFYWHYESPDCIATSDPPFISTSGAIIVANNGGSDFALLQLTENPANALGAEPYFLGWDRTGNPGTGGVGIHHPHGDIKKIATYNQTPQNHFTGNFWSFNWMPTPNGYSVTEIGSSGSPLINNNHQIIGQLYGCTYKDCSNPVNDLAIYGKFSVSWAGDTNPKKRLKDWLDPLGSNAQTLDGIALGVWPCPPLASNIPIIYTTTITANTIWNSDIGVYGKISIRSGVTLTIQNATVYLTPASSILIHPGGKLILDGGTLTNACPDQMWKGVTVMGDPALPPSTLYQGYAQQSEKIFFHPSV